ncbi:MAG: zinc ribbon domain-containing protein [Candidatus Thiodiazotropha sp. (ex Dulcina madagascariensis)]|nr:zinc ribbon domain-containing protein [Candidatus Thiodiazotropha sp. (ex Dulcina madagascariensis)]
MEFIFLMVIWLLLIPVVLNVAESKGLSVWGYFLFALIFSPIIAIIFALITPANAEKQEARAIKEGKAKKCPYCAELVKVEAAICKHCGRDLADQPASPAIE